MSGRKPMKQTERVVQGPAFGRGPMGGGMVGQKAHDFRASGRRLLGLLRPARWRAVGVLLLAVGSVASVVVGPWLLGKATDLVFTGFVGKQLEPAGTTKADVVNAAEARATTSWPTSSAASTSCPARGSTSARSGGC